MALQIYQPDRHGVKYRAGSVSGSTAIQWLKIAPQFFTPEFGDIWTDERKTTAAYEGWKLLSELVFLVDGKKADGTKYTKDDNFSFADAAKRLDEQAATCLGHLRTAFLPGQFPIYLHILLAHAAQLMRKVRSSVLGCFCRRLSD